MLGLIMIELDRLEDATACLRDAVQKTPTLGAAWRGLAEVMTRLGDAAAADVVYDAGIANVPHDPRLRLAAMMAAIREQNFTRVAAIGLSARRDGLADACIFGLLGHSLSKLDRHGEAADYYQDALRLAPEDPYVRHLVRAAGLLPGVDRAPLRYVEAVFDGYAANFDQHLMSLGYRVPGQIRDILSGLIEDSEVATLGEVLDLGCGTGLVGLLVSDLPMTSLTGVDISENMVEKARSKQVYGEIFISDLVPFLDQDGSRWDCILGGDVFCYFGVLDLVFESIWRALRPGGLFVCNVEAAGPTSDVGWRLESQGRYVHRADYVRSCLLRAGFTVSEFSSQTLRFEGGAPVDGLYVMARKNGHNA
jgi:predicted TPR repeat methyltransferase